MEKGKRKKNKAELKHLHTMKRKDYFYSRRHFFPSQCTVSFMRICTMYKNLKKDEMNAAMEKIKINVSEMLGYAEKHSNQQN